MSRPTTLTQGNTVYWTLMTYTSAGVLVDADSTPTVAVRKNGVATADVVTVTKRSATTGIYDCTYNPASEVEGDTYTLEETATISSQAYVNAWSFDVRGETFDASSDTVANVSTVGSVTNAVTTDAASRTASQADVSALATAASISALNDFDPSTDTVANVTTTASVTNAVTTDAASRTASQANISGLSTFDPSTDTVANVTTVGSVTNAVTTDAASRTASQADVSSLATAAAVAALNDLSQADVRTAVGLASANLDTQLGDIPTVSEFEARTLVAAAYFDPSSDTVANVTTVGSVTNGVTASTVTDKTGYSISGTKTTLDALNDLSTAEVNAQVDLGLSDIGLDHLVSASVTGVDIVDNSIIARMVSKSATADWDSFDNTTDALEAIRDRGDSAWVTGSAYSLHPLAYN